MPTPSLAPIFARGHDPVRTEGFVQAAQHRVRDAPAGVAGQQVAEGVVGEDRHALLPRQHRQRAQALDAGRDQHRVDAERAHDVPARLQLIRFADQVGDVALAFAGRLRARRRVRRASRCTWVRNAASSGKTCNSSSLTRWKPPSSTVRLSPAMVAVSSPTAGRIERHSSGPCAQRRSVRGCPPRRSPDRARNRPAARARPAGTGSGSQAAGFRRPPRSTAAPACPPAAGAGSPVRPPNGARRRRRRRRPRSASVYGARPAPPGGSSARTERTRRVQSRSIAGTTCPAMWVVAALCSIAIAIAVAVAVVHGRDPVAGDGVVGRSPAHPTTGTTRDAACAACFRNSLQVSLQRFGEPPVFGGGDLDIGFLAGDRRHPQAGAQRELHGRLRLPALRPVRVRSAPAGRVRLKACGDWNTPASCRGRASTAKPSRRRATGTSGSTKAPAQPVARAASITRRSSPTLTNGRATSCNSSQSPRACSASRATLSWRLPPPASTRQPGSRRVASSSRSAGTATMTSSATCKALSASQHSSGRPARDRYPLVPWPRRRPAPAAGIRQDTPCRACPRWSGRRHRRLGQARAQATHLGQVLAGEDLLAKGIGLRPLPGADRLEPAGSTRG